MSETLIGVLIGGAIASLAPLVTLLLGERRWRHEARLTHLRSERQRAEDLYEKNLKMFAQGAADNSYSSNMSSDMFVLMPPEVCDIYKDHMAKKDKTDLDHKAAYLHLAAAMKRDLKARNEQILKLLGSK